MVGALQAVEAWRSLVAPRTVSPPKADESPDTDKAPQNGTAAGKGSGEAVEVTPAAKQQFVRGMKKHAFTMIDLVEKGSYYFRNALGQAPQGENDTNQYNWDC